MVQESLGADSVSDGFREIASRSAEEMGRAEIPNAQGGFPRELHVMFRTNRSEHHITHS
jgi:hypothetical protein